MKQANKSKLARLFADVKTKRDEGFDISPEFLRKEFGLTNYGTSCLLYMLAENEYCPELEKLYKQQEVPPLVGKDEATDFCIKLNEDMPPYTKGLYLSEDIPVRNQAIYLSMGVARRANLEEYRQMLIRMYVGFSRILEQWRLDVLEALAHGDKKFFEEEFADKPDSEIKKWLKKYGLKRTQIESALKLMHSD